METFPAFFPLKDRRVVIAGRLTPEQTNMDLTAGLHDAHGLPK